MKNGVCPKCQSTEIYTDARQPKRGDRCSLPVTTWTKVFVDLYICLRCGFFEEYIRPEDLKNEKMMEKVRQQFRKL